MDAVDKRKYGSGSFREEGTFGVIFFFIGKENKRKPVIYKTASCFALMDISLFFLSFFFD